MVCKEIKCLFVHVPKTAGQSIERYLLHRLGSSWEERDAFLLRANSDPAVGPERLAHLTAEEYVTLGHVSQEDFDSMYRFGFVRDPWNRLVSEYLYRSHHLDFTFRDWLFDHQPEPGPSDEYRHVMPQYAYLFDGEGRSLVDFVGRFEDLKSDWAKVCEALGYEDTVLPRVNEAGSGRSVLGRLADRVRLKEPRRVRYKDYYDDETRELVAERYADDIREFGYAF